jgi:hypothetical protein
MCYEWGITPFGGTFYAKQPARQILYNIIGFKSLQFCWKFNIVVFLV